MPPIPPASTEFIFLGTGTSASLPYIDCITSSRKDEQCTTCLSTMTPEGRRNVRRNTSAVVRMDAQDGRKVTIVIDAGKTFQAASLEWFPKYGLRKIDAVLLTHGHADAMNGLDDLRAWTLYGLIQPYIDIYLSQDTFEAVQRSFPYLVSKEFASGGGDVPEFQWHIIDDKVPFEINDTGIQVLPFAVHHGHIRSCAAVQFPTMPLTTPGLPGTTKASGSDDNLSLQTSSCESESSLKATDDHVRPYHSFGFKIAQDIIYISDVSYIPEDVWPLLTPSEGSPAPPICVLDCLQIKSHVSHFSLSQAIDTARRIGADKTYLTGFCHEASHEEYVQVTSIVGGERIKSSKLSAIATKALATVTRGDPIWVRPAHDGLRVFVNYESRTAHDETYFSHAAKRGLKSALSSLRGWLRTYIPPISACGR